MPKARGREPTDEERSEAAGRLLYETLMLCNTAALLDADGPRGGSWQELTRYMALVESLLGHASSLLRFLYPPKRARAGRRRDGEVFAFDYCAAAWRAAPWEGVRELRRSIERDRRRLSVAELPAMRSWEYGRLVAALRGCLASFLEDAEHLPVRTREQLHALLERRDEEPSGVLAPLPAMPVLTLAGGDARRQPADAAAPTRPPAAGRRGT